MRTTEKKCKGSKDQISGANMVRAKVDIPHSGPKRPNFKIPWQAIPRVVEENAAEIKMEVPSWGTGDKPKYRVLILKEDGSVYCECKSFHYRGRCHHISYLVGLLKKPDCSDNFRGLISIILEDGD